MYWGQNWLYNFIDLWSVQLPVEQLSTLNFCHRCSHSQVVDTAIPRTV